MFFGWVFIILDFVRRSGTTRAEGPHVGPQHVRGAKRSRIDHSRAHGLLTGCFTALYFFFSCPGRHGAGGGSNYPLSGWKHYVFEGGVRSASFIYAPSLIPPARQGTVHGGLFHAVDWLPTLATLAGVPHIAGSDGFDIWDALVAGGTASPRTEIPVEIAACNTTPAHQSIVDGPQAAMIVGELKVMLDCWWRGGLA